MSESSNFKRLVRFTLWTTSTLVVTYTLLELVLRIFDPVGISYVFEAKQYFAQMQKNSAYGYIHAPNQVLHVGGIDARINSEGFRGDDFQLQKSEGQRRVILLGDSVVFSWGVADDDTLTKQLQRNLRARQISDVEVLPVGVGSWNTRTQWEFMKERGFQYEPDIIVHIPVNNDIQPKSGARSFITPKELFLYKKQNSKLFSWWQTATEYSYGAAAIQRIFTQKNLSEEMLTLYQPNTPQRRDIADAFSELAARCRSKQIPLIGFIYGETNSPLGIVYRDFFLELYREQNLTLHFFPEELYRGEFQNSVIDDHRNPAGLKLMADFIAQKLVPFLSSQK